MTLPPPYIAKDNKVINTKSGRVLKVSKKGSYLIKGKIVQHNAIFNIPREERIGTMLKDNNGNIYISIRQAQRELKLTERKVNELIDYGEFKIL